MTFAYGVGARFTVEVDGFDDEGRGRGHFEGVDVAVRGAAPGDVCVVRTERAFRARRLIQARAESWTRQSPLHKERACPHPGPCPACPFEGLDRTFELAAKIERVRLAWAGAGLDPDLVDDVTWGPQYHGRQRVKLTAQGGHRPLTLGMYVPHSHTLRPASGCPYARPALARTGRAIEQALRATQAWANTDERPGIKGVILRDGPTGVTAAVLSRTPLSDEVWRGLATLRTADDDLVWVQELVDPAPGNSLVGGQPGRSTGPRPEGAESPTRFCQPDPDLAQRLYDDVAAWLADRAPLCLDLYAGDGGFSAALKAQGARRVIGVESAVDAQAALAHAADESVHGTVEAYLSGPLPEGPLAVVADPPRKGLGPDVVRALADGPVVALALVSCDVRSLTRDALALSAAGFVPEAVRPFDFFPGTAQVEVLSRWTRP